MPRAVSFNTQYFNESGGYSITEVTGAVNRYAFRNFLSELETDRGGVDLGLPQPVDSGQLYQILAQLRVPPVVDGVKHIDLTGVYPTVEYIASNDGFRDVWVIGDNRGGGLRGTTKDDLILAGRGDDIVLGQSGADFINGGDGNDVLGGGGGDDFLFGDTGNDLLRGRRGDDILQGGAGNDTLSGAQGADTFMFQDSDFSGASSVDIIRDYHPRQGDQIVDTTGLLKVEKTGDISPYGNGTGTILVNELTNDRVIVYGARVRDKDILNQYVEPDVSPDGARSIPREGIYVGGTPTPPTGAGIVAFDLQRIAGYQDGDDFIETYQVTVRNNTDRTILNTAELDIKLAGGTFDIVAGSVFGGRYSGGTFDLASGGRRALPGESEVSVLQFSVANRSPLTPISIDGSSANDFSPEFSGSQDTYYQPAFQITVEISGRTDEGGTAEVFITNIGNTTLQDLDNMVFSFSDGDITVTDSPWGADYFSDRFAVEPWSTSNGHGALAQGETTKLFGFTYELDDGSDAKVDVNDFRLKSDFDDLIS
ncbi:calcium-binding protein [Acuticoccus sp. I52.16.1]|uniref:calcium-binding protein n=1 Tax=Acuticoccus sp. I52.16.1 TaxID=2928472 RepID=UPI001FD15095|nr:calcium-binding protein [Acuticoccus sp. I52.16.1]UOM36063.1 hypothetical protein MRB58_07665 [Acuticoccus sp. I52.16.1]